MTKPAIPDVLPRFVAYYRAHPSWGSLHVVLDDGNIEDVFVRGCAEYAREQNDAEGGALADILLTMSKTQRGKISRLARASRQEGDAL